MKNFLEEQREIELIKEVEKQESEIKRLQEVMTQLDKLKEIEKAKSPAVLEKERVELLKRIRSGYYG